jgi:hypothetical protein
MDSKDKKKIDQAYLELSYKNRSDIENVFLIKFDLLQDKPSEEKPSLFFKLLSPQSINEIECLGIYEYLSGKPINALLDGIYTTSRLNYLKTSIRGQGDLNFRTGGYDCMQVNYFTHAFAANDFTLGELILQKHPKISKKGHRFLVTLNNILYLIFLHGDSENNEIEKIGTGFLSKKNPEYENHVISFLINFVNREYEKANIEFISALNIYKKNKSLHEFFNDLNKFIAIPLLGIHSFLKKYIGEEKMRFINISDTEVLNKDILDFHSSGKDFVTFTGKLNFVQTLIEQIGK